MSNLTHEQLSQVRDCKARLTLGFQSVATCIAGGVPIKALRIALTGLGRDAEREISEATGERV